MTGEQATATVELDVAGAARIGSAGGLATAPEKGGQLFGCVSILGWGDDRCIHSSPGTGWVDAVDVR
ncbi:hypothetical protein EV644_15019 [Kribbella orskensis]|uniref:Uncharacterized protein n=1 Tax=Kribbella orskensis TaxID=2512216 RepID=A0ABY2B661_9ACTN|nr:hypothetical protein EV642_1105 [Kribbella sp. VKM Ac-2500]TCO08074.1 hypothetical protein EV644_15019 [Kribbella orskensis]